MRVFRAVCLLLTANPGVELQELMPLLSVAFLATPQTIELRVEQARAELRRDETLNQEDVTRYSATVLGLGSTIEQIAVARSAVQLWRDDPDNEAFARGIVELREAERAASLGARRMIGGWRRFVALLASTPLAWPPDSAIALKELMQGGWRGANPLRVHAMSEILEDVDVPRAVRQALQEFARAAEVFQTCEQRVAARLDALTQGPQPTRAFWKRLESLISLIDGR